MGNETETKTTETIETTTAVAALLQHSKPEKYIGVGGYTKMRAKIFYVEGEGTDATEVAVDVAKAEPVLNDEGELVGWAWYCHGGLHRMPGETTGNKTPKFFSSLRQLLDRMNKCWAVNNPAPKDYKKASGSHWLGD
jgi:hypothetical protein